MRVEQRKDGIDERRILEALLTDKTVLAKIAPIWNGELFRSEHANIIAAWAFKHFDSYGEPLKDKVEERFAAWSAKRRDKGTSQAIERLLELMSAEYRRKKHDINTAHVLDVAGAHFDRVRLSRLAELVEGHLQTGDVDAAREAVTGFARLSIASDSDVDVLGDADAMRDAFTRKSDPLIVYPGALGEFFGDSLERDGFVAILAPEKRGKTFWLFDMAWRGMLQDRRVAFFQCGDLSQAQMMQRIARRVAMRPIQPVPFLYPTKIEKVERKPKENKSKARVEVEHEERTNDKKLSVKRTIEKLKKIQEKRLKADDPRFRLVTRPNDTISANGVRDKIREWDREGWVPDVVVVDYADILAAPPNMREQRDAINANWKRLRSISQEFHCLVITATQANAASYDADLIRRRNFSDDKRKYGHVTGMFAVNQSEPEKELDVTRLNWLARREHEYSERRVVYVAGCRPCNAIAVRSTW